MQERTALPVSLCLWFIGCGPPSVFASRGVSDLLPLKFTFKSTLAGHLIVWMACALGRLLHPHTSPSG